ncbi:MAG: ABC transporter substrate-binding protein [Lautropia sp.]|nr:ABC transporter substrate-binding protein [Lautropia sp.]
MACVNPSQTSSTFMALPASRATPSSPLPRPTRRQLLQAGAGLALTAGLPGLASADARAAPGGTPATARLRQLVLAGPFATVSNPLIRIVDSGALADLAEQVEFSSWKNPDQLRAMALQGKADFLAVPSNVAANLYNRGVRLQLMNIGIWGILWVVSRDPARKTMADLKGQEVVMPFRGDMPDFVFRLVARQQGIDPDRDIRLRYVASPLDAMQLLITRRADNALLAEPAVSVGLRKTQSFPVSAVAPTLHRGVNLQEEWGRVFKRPARIPQAGIVMMGPQLGNARLAERFQSACTEALQWCENNAEACGQAVARRIDLLTPEGVADAIRVDHAEIVPAAQARAELDFFYQQLLEFQPGLIGGKLPGKDFYYGT